MAIKCWTSMSLRRVFLPPLLSAISDSSIVRTMYNCRTQPIRISHTRQSDQGMPSGESLSCNCNWGIGTAPPTGRLRVHHKTIISVSIGRLKQKCFQLTTESSCSSVAFSMLAMRRHRKPCMAIICKKNKACQFYDPPTDVWRKKWHILSVSKLTHQRSC